MIQYIQDYIISTPPEIMLKNHGIILRLELKFGNKYYECLWKNLELTKSIQGAINETQKELENE